MIDPQYLVSLGALVAMATTVVSMAAFRLRKHLLKQSVTESVHTEEAMLMPVFGSVTLFSLYVLLRFIPKEYFNFMISSYLSVISIFALGTFLEHYRRPNVLSGLLCVGLGGYYFWTKNWIANNVLAFAIGVSALEMVPISNFATSFILLIGLFFYDIFWVFGSDVMLTVATGVDGPIKLLFPRTVLGDHTGKSLLGLGDLIVPGFFICQTLTFSRDIAKRGNLYFIIAIVAYVLSLLNTMVVLVLFEHGQPALLFIVPWLLITFTVAVLHNGDWKAAWDYDAVKTFESKETQEVAGSEVPALEENISLSGIVWNAILHLFGLEGDQEKSIKHDSPVRLGDVISPGKKNA